MTTDNQEQASNYFVRRVTKQLLQELVPEGYVESRAVGSSDENGFDALWDGAQKIGRGLKEIFGGAVFHTKPKSFIKSGRKVPNIYGYFLVEIAGGKVTVNTNFIKPTPGAEVFLVADLVGLPLARIEGQVEKSFLDAAPGQFTAASYAVDMWLDPGLTSWSSQPTNPQEDKTQREREDDQRVGRFLQAFMQGRDDLTIEEFCRVAKEKLNSIAQTTLTLTRLNLPNGEAKAKVDFQDGAIRLFGLSTVVHIRPGSKIYRHHLTLDEGTISQSQELSESVSDALIYTDEGRKWKCGCGRENLLADAFCQECGTQKPSVVKENSTQNRRLLSSDAEQIVFDVSFFSYDTPNVSFDNIAVKCIEVLRPYCRKFPLASLGDINNLKNIANLLNVEFGTRLYGPVGEFAIIDLRSANSDWQLQTRANINEQLRGIATTEAQLDVAVAAHALREAQLVSARREREIYQNETREELEGERFEKDISLERTSLDINKQVDERKIYAKSEIDIEKVDRDVERQRRGLDREDFKEAQDVERSDQVSQLDHEMELEKKVLRHDIGKEQVLDDVQRLKNEKDLDFEERAARIRAMRGLDIAKQEQELEIEKKRKEQDIELNKSQSEQDFQLKKLQMLGELERQQKEQYRGLTPAQILAMQATGLAEKGAVDALGKLAGADADVAKAQAEAEAKSAKEKSDLYERMLQMQSNSTEQMLRSRDSSDDRQMEIIKSSLNAQKDAGDKVIQAHEKTVDNAQAWNEKSIDAMAKVSTAASETRGNQNVKVDIGSGKIKCSKCGAVNESHAKFCANCAHPQ